MKTKITKQEYNDLHYKIATKDNAFKISMVLLTIFFISVLLLANTTKITVIITGNFTLFSSIFLTRSPLRRLDELVRDGKTYEEIREEFNLEKELPG